MNPEFRRNIWLELTTHRVIAMPLILSLIFGLTISLSGSVFDRSVSHVAGTAFVLLVIVWGCRQSAEAVLSEISTRTWDHQRLSSLSAWNMTWGKLYGAPIFSLYGGLFCLLVLFLSTTGEHSFQKSLLITILYALCGLFAQSFAMFLSLAGLRQGRAYTWRRSAFYQVLAILMGLQILIPTLISSTFEELRTDITWYGFVFPGLLFYICSIALFYIWSIIGLHQLMRKELQITNSPLLWSLFIVFALFYCSGLIKEDSTIFEKTHEEWVWQIRIYSACITCWLITLFAVFFEAKDVVLLRRLYAAVKSRHWQQVGYLIPRWAIAFCFVLISLAISLILPLPTSNAIFGPNNTPDFFRQTLVSQTLFLLRDIGIFMLFCLGNKRQGGEFAVLIYLSLLYIVLPQMLNAFGGEDVLFIFYSILAENWLEAILPGLLQTALIAVLLKLHWQKLSRKAHSDVPIEEGNSATA